MRTIGLLQALLGSAELEIDLPAGSCVNYLLRSLGQTGGPEVARRLSEGGDGLVPPSPRVLVNGRDVGVRDGWATVLGDADDILILTPMAGG